MSTIYSNSTSKGSDQKVIKINQDIFNIGRKNRNVKTQKNKVFSSSSQIPPLKNNIRKKLLERLDKNRQNILAASSSSKNDTQSFHETNKQNQYPLNDEIEMPEENNNNELEHSINYLSELSKVNKNNNQQNKSPNHSNINYKVDNQIGYGCLKNGIKPCYRKWVKTCKNRGGNNDVHSQQSNHNNINTTSQSQQKEEKLKNIRKKLVEKIQEHKKIVLNNKILSPSPLHSPSQSPSPYSNESFQQPYSSSSSMSASYEDIDSESDFPYEKNNFSVRISENNNVSHPYLQPHIHSQPYSQPHMQPQQVFNENRISNYLGDNNTNDNIFIQQQPQQSEEEILISSFSKNNNNQNDDNHYKNDNNMTIPITKTIKKITKKRYTLGKNFTKRKVGLLLKNINTRKKIITAHKDLKSKPLNDVKKYLRQHGLIKVGSSCPQDCLRKIYESAMLTGEVINTNPDTLLHNMLKETVEE